MLPLVVVTEDDIYQVYVTETVYAKDTGNRVVERTFLNNKLHAPPDGSPSRIEYGYRERLILQSWHKAGILHREDGPASIGYGFDAEDFEGLSRPTVYSYFIDGKPRDRELGPMHEHLDFNTGKVIKKIFRRPKKAEASSAEDADLGET